VVCKGDFGEAHEKPCAECCVFVLGWVLTLWIAAASPTSYAKNQNQDQQERQQLRVSDIDVWNMIIRDSIVS